MGEEAEGEARPWDFEVMEDPAQHWVFFVEAVKRENAEAEARLRETARHSQWSFRAFQAAVEDAYESCSDTEPYPDDLSEEEQCDHSGCVTGVCDMMSQP